VKVTTWNVNGIRAREAMVLRWVEEERPDVLCLQEIKASPEDVPGTLAELPGYHYYWHGHKGYSGVALHLRRETFPAAPIFGHPDFDREHRVVTAQIADLCFASIYVPNGGKDYPAKLQFLEALDAWAEEAERHGVRLCVVGDMNVAIEPRDVHPRLQNPVQIGQREEERALFRRLLGRGLVDLHRRFEPGSESLFTWWAPWRKMRERNMGWRLDYVLVSPRLAEHARSCAVAPGFGTSDHGPVTATFDPVVLEGLPREPTPEPGTPTPPPTGQLKLDL
jgi:exodeoxyribonuclease-3